MISIFYFHKKLMRRSDFMNPKSYPTYGSLPMGLHPSPSSTYFHVPGARECPNCVFQGYGGTFQEIPQSLFSEGQREQSLRQQPLHFPGTFTSLHSTLGDQFPLLVHSNPFTREIPKSFPGWNQQVLPERSSDFYNSSINPSLVGISPYISHNFMLPSSRSYHTAKEQSTPQFAAPVSNKDANEMQSRSKEPSLGEFSSEDDKAVKLPGKAANRRNVYKSCVRHMHSYIFQNKEQIEIELKAAGYPSERIIHAFEKVRQYSDIEKPQGKKISAQKVMKKIIEKKSIYTYILIGTLKWMLENWGKGDFGKMFKKNVSVYKEVCHKYLEAAQKVLHPADLIRQGS